MDFVYIGLLILLILTVSVTRRSAKNKRIRNIGAQGEASVAHQLARLPQQNYKVQNDLMLQKGDGRTAQIDHVVISPFGVFVIETKFRHGRIYGNGESVHWTQHIGQKTHQFESPIHQNQVHVRTIREHLPFIDGRHIHSLVVFPTDTELHIQGAKNVIPEDKLIMSIRKHNVEVLSGKEVQRVQQILKHHDILGTKARKAHIRDVKSHQ